MSNYEEMLEKIKEKNATVLVVGLGYIGLPTLLYLARQGLTVKGLDINKTLVNELRKGKIRIVEKGLSSIIKKYIKSIELHTTYTDIGDIDICILCLPSPIDKHRKPVTKYLEDSISELGQLHNDRVLIILESTVPVGTTERLSTLFGEKRNHNLDKDYWFAHCPERVMPGKILEELDINHRLVGGVSEDSTALATTFYRTVFNSNLIHPTTSRISETAKLAENAFRDINIAYANELAKLCNALSIDVFETIELANLHPRVDILKPGLGVGGYCFPKDGWILVDSAKENGGEAIVIPAARKVNDSMPTYVSVRIREVVTQLHAKPAIGLLGLSYKSNVSDTRNSPTLELHKLLTSTGMDTIVYDPLVKQSYESIKRVEKLDDIIVQCETIVLCVGHDIILKELNSKDLSSKIFVDPWNLLPELRSNVKKYLGLSE